MCGLAWPTGPRLADSDLERVPTTSVRGQIGPAPCFCITYELRMVLNILKCLGKNQEVNNNIS